MPWKLFLLASPLTPLSTHSFNRVSTNFSLLAEFHLSVLCCPLLPPDLISRGKEGGVGEGLEQPKTAEESSLEDRKVSVCCSRLSAGEEDNEGDSGCSIRRETENQRF